MAALQSLRSSVAVLLLLTALAVQTQLAHSQQCTSQLNNLNVCAPFVLPGAANTSPSAECCNALEAVQNKHEARRPARERPKNNVGTSIIEVSDPPILIISP
ncbi:hypothetical protein SADUNF_Sadunf15G0116800 [Salix dunnii]|uniref:Bifunctional inhibitor/plant lipid transfer protein/seed storage helical domain-containing protein n=1 Tax=Salix dunnii TaxID=1413687 RepID=A0A835JDS7_9ROSI|nr:hypothetical protein SADUNF_Sadunf15G0116800 [Salix dunnii]